LIADFVARPMGLSSLDSQLAQSLSFGGQRLCLRAQLADALLVSRAFLFEPLQVGRQLGDLCVEVLGAESRLLEELALAIDPG
jgi:hypothetical protein